MKPLKPDPEGITAGLRTSYLDWCSGAEPEDAYVYSANFAVEVDLDTGVAYTREVGRPLLRSELNPDVDDDDELPWWLPEWERERCIRCEHWHYEHDNGDGV